MKKKGAKESNRRKKKSTAVIVENEPSKAIKSRNTSAKRSSKTQYKYPSADAIMRVNARLMGVATGSYEPGQIGDAVERRIIEKYNTVLGEDPLSSNEKSRGEQIQILKRLATSDKMNHAIMSQCHIAYLSYGIVRVVVDLYADFATEGLEILHPNKSVENFYRAWATKVHLKERVNRFFTDLFVSANVFIHKIRAKINPEEERSMRRAQANNVELLDANTLLIRGGGNSIDVCVSPNLVLDSELTPFFKLCDVADKQIKNGNAICSIAESPDVTIDVNKRKIPWEYISLPPVNIESRDRNFANRGRWVLVLNKDDVSSVSNFLRMVYDPHNKKTKIKLPPSLSGKLAKYEGKSRYYKAEVSLPPDDVYVVQDKKFDNWTWAIPFVFPSLRCLRFKDNLRNMEKKFCNSVINSITLWELGDPENGIFPEDEHFERLADMLQQPGQAMNLIWPAPIKGSVIEPRSSNALDPRKHESIDRDTLVSLGIPDVLIGGKGSNFSNSFISVATTLKKLEVARDRIEAWLMNELKEIAEAMGFRKLPRIKWGKSSLRDKKWEQQFKLQLFDRGVLSAEALLKEADEHLDTEVQRQKNEKNIADSTGVGVLDKHTPYYRPADLVKVGIMPPGWKPERNMLDIKEQEAEVDIKIDKKRNDTLNPEGGDDKKPTKPEGRPPGKQDTQKRKKKEPVPRGNNVAAFIKFDSLKEQGAKLLDTVGSMLKTKGKRGPVSEKLLYSVVSNLTAGCSKTDITKTIKSLKSIKNNKINASVNKPYEFLVNYYRVKSIDNKLSKDQKRDIFIYAWAVANMINLL